MEKPKDICLPVLSVFSLFFAGGIAVSSWLRLEALPAGLLSLGAGILCAVCLKGKNYFFFLMLWAFVLGEQSWSVRTLNSGDNIVHRIGSKVRMTVTVISDSTQAESRSLLVKVSTVWAAGKTVRTSGRVWVKLTKSVSSSEEYFYGDRLFLTGRLTGPHSFDQRFLSSLRADAVFYARQVQRRGWDKRYALNRLAFFVRRMLARSLERHSPTAAAVLDAMLLGLKSRMPVSVKNEAIRAGTWHVFVVSGSHVALVAFIVTLFFKVLRIRSKPRIFLSLGFVWLYCLACGASAPVLRATVMASVFLLSFFWERNPLHLHHLFLAGLVILLIDPSELFSVGFQLSFLSVFFMAWLYPVLDFSESLKERLTGPAFLKHGVVYTVRGCLVSFCAWLGTAPLLAYVFGQFSPVSILANVLILPLSCLVMAAGFATLCLGWIRPLAGLFAQASEGLLFLLLAVNKYFAGLKYLYFSGVSLPLAVVWGIYIFLILAVVVKNARDARRSFWTGGS